MGGAGVAPRLAIANVESVVAKTVVPQIKISPILLANSTPETSSGANTEGDLNVPGRVQSRINITNEGWAHVVDRHFGNKNASKFTVSQGELRSLLSQKDVVETPITRTVESKGKGTLYIREVTFDNPIGLDKYDNYNPTSRMTIMTDKFGNLETATPGVVK
ncbi:hypothetical protein ACDQ55_21580 [Chitinophaga sp. 30R24]|uniref:hypothetical protein n=1 Tax=Chitinophaga sp. 30R24 TaxID=3248838 RepID=UPI003B917CE1